MAGTSVCNCGAPLDGALADGTPCPRCKGAVTLTRKTLSPECAILSCERCGGILATAPAWGELIDRADQSDPRFVGVGGFPKKHLTLQELVPLLTCPGCKREMDRIAFAGRTKISLDVCSIHGIWFDGGELGKVLAILQYKSMHGGELPPPSRAGGELDTQERREKVLESMGISDPLYDVRHAPIPVRDRFDVNRLAGRVAFVAGGFEGVAAFHLLKAAASGASVAAEWAFRRAAETRPSLQSRAPLRCLYCGTIHAEADTECVRCRAPIVRVVCTACGSRVGADETRCTCGAPLLPPAAKGELACPRCKCALDPIRLDGTMTAHRCARCLGAFFDIFDWSALVDRSVAGEPLPLTSFNPLPAGRALPTAAFLAGAMCSHCRSPMERITFAGESKVVVDVCAAHGMWLDAGELVALCAFVRAGTPIALVPEVADGDETVKDWGRG